MLRMSKAAINTIACCIYRVDYTVHLVVKHTRGGYSDLKHSSDVLSVSITVSKNLIVKHARDVNSDTKNYISSAVLTVLITVFTSV